MLKYFRKAKQLKTYEFNKRNINLFGNILINRFSKTRMIFPPHRIDLEPTTRCNLNCFFCQVPGWNRSLIKDLSIVDFKSIINKFPSLKSVKLQGMGEPFLNTEILEMIDFCNQKGIYSTIYNNGTVLNEVIIKELFKSPPSFLVFSLDTPGREAYKVIRGKDMFEKVIENIKLTVFERNKIGSATEINIWCVLNKYNIMDVSNLVGLAKELGVDNVGIQTKLTCFGKAELKKKNDCIEISIFDQEIMEYLDKAVELAKNINQNIDLYRDDYFSKSKPCNLIKHSTYVSVEGEIVPCCIIADPSIVSMGNIHNVNSINDIWNNKLYRNLRKNLYENRLPSFCKNCYR
jgi:pyrroloquinoline quinone biosynthesis protein E